MDKKLIIDCRMRSIEKEYLKSIGYNIIELNRQNHVYEEISSHVDVFCVKINNKIILEPCVYNEFMLDGQYIIKGKSYLKEKYPFDIAYNVCQIGQNVVHNFKYTDEKVLEIMQKEKLNMININQGYSNCSIAVIDSNSAIVTDKNIAEILIKNKIDVLLIDDDLDIKLLKNNAEYSNMKGFIGGCITRLDDNVVIFGELSKIDRHGKIRKFIESRALKIIEFRGMDVIDYGGILALD